MVKRKQVRRATAIIAVILTVLTIGGIAWTKRAIWTTESLKFARVEPGQIKHEVPVQATFANNETLIPAPVGGKVAFTGADGERFRRGEQVGTITPEGMVPGGKPVTGAQTLVAPVSGLFYRWTDGLETLFTVSDFMNMNLGQLLAQVAKPKNIPSSVQAGEYIGKIVNNLQPSVAFVELPSLQDVTNGKYLNLIGHDQTQRVKVLRKSEKPQGVVVQFAAFLDGTVDNRCQQLLWVAKPPVSGMTIPAQALWTQGSDQGVFAAVDGVIRFRKVTVQDRDGDRVCVSGPEAGTPVVINPRTGIEGEPAGY